jgi:hypothetical protein
MIKKTSRAIRFQISYCNNTTFGDQCLQKYGLKRMKSITYGRDQLKITGSCSHRSPSQQGNFLFIDQLVL